MIRVAIVDDEDIIRKETARKIEKLLVLYKQPYKIVMFSKGTDFLEGKVRYDIIFMDIDMPEMDGVEAARAYQEYGEEDVLIFLTNHESMWRQGYVVNAFRFIVKQDNDEVLQEALVSAFHMLNNRKKLCFQLCKGGEVYLRQMDILYIEAWGRNAYLKSKDEEYEVMGKISDLAVTLETEGFYLIHRTYLVNLYHVRQYKKRNITLSNGNELPVSERKVADFKNCLFHYQFERGNK